MMRACGFMVVYVRSNSQLELQDHAINGRFNAYHVMSPKRRWSTVEQVYGPQTKILDDRRNLSECVFETLFKGL
jgi:hypothetical protein